MDLKNLCKQQTLGDKINPQGLHHEKVAVASRYLDITLSEKRIAEGKVNHVKRHYQQLKQRFRESVLYSDVDDSDSD